MLELIGQRFWGTIQLQSIALLLGLLIAIPVGIVSATRQYSATDNSVTVGSFIGLALPNFWLALLLQIWLGVELGWLPTISTGQGDVAYPERLKYLVMPVIVLVLPNIAYFARFMRSSMLEVIHQDYVTTARAKGLSGNTVLYRHALRNALIPMVTVIGLQLPRILGGAVIIEQIFAWPGIGALDLRRDHPAGLSCHPGRHDDHRPRGHGRQPDHGLHLRPGRSPGFGRGIGIFGRRSAFGVWT